MHYWIGSFCQIIDSNSNKVLFPTQVVAISDIITLVADIGNKIPDKSWMLYLLELFNIENIAAELNLICSFNNQGKFDAIFNGVNQYQFKEIQPTVDHSYLRQIILDYEKKCISYLLQDKNTNQIESYDLRLEEQSSFKYQGFNHFTGIEWWNKVWNYPYPIRYIVEYSQLMFGITDPTHKESIVYFPYNALRPNNDPSCITYPISFYNIGTKDGCICYTVQSGSSNRGISYSLF
ncbi:MAG: hypothetical protein ACJ72C_12120 [Nitrososphaeraceae archaeon]